MVQSQMFVLNRFNGLAVQNTMPAGESKTNVVYTAFVKKQTNRNAFVSSIF